MRASIRVGLILSFLGTATACGGSQKEADDPNSESGKMAMPSNMGHGDDDKSEAEGKSDDDTGDKEDKDDKDDKDDKKSDKKSSKSDKSDKSDDDKPAKQTAKDIITKTNSLYVYSFADSEPHQEAEKKCKESSKDDPKKAADCLTKASKGQDRDALAFQANGDKVNYIAVDRKGGTITILHKVPCDIGSDSESKITLKCTGKDEGKKPGGVPKEVTLELDGESAIVITDPKLGRLVYQAKLGLMGNQER